MVVWCDCVGGLQLWPDPLPWSGPNVPGGSTQRGQEIGTSPEYCLHYRDVSTLSKYLGWVYKKLINRRFKVEKLHSPHNCYAQG